MSAQPHYNLSLDDGEIRLHIPVRTNQDVDFIVEGQRVVMAEGECWSPTGVTARVHLTLDCVIDDRLRDVVVSTAASD